MGLFTFFFPPSKSRQNCKKKTRYPNQARAQEALKRINPRKNPGKPIRTYKCHDCSGYHLTSKPA